MIQIDPAIQATSLLPAIEEMFRLSAGKIRRLRQRWDPARGTPVFTAAGLYTARGWTEWTQGFQFGAEILQFEATGDEEFLQAGRDATLRLMAPHLTHTGVHDHGFNNVSTYGNLLRLMRAGRIPRNDWEAGFYRLALKVSGAVQAARWTALPNGGGFVHSFNGPHSLFADTIRSMRALALSHQLGHRLMGENDRVISLFDRLVSHAAATSAYNVYFGRGRDTWDIRGRVAHESIFNLADGAYRCPSSQQGYSPFSTWTRGLAWILLGYAEELEYLDTRPDSDFNPHGGRQAVTSLFLETALAVADFYIQNTPSDGIPYWDTGAPGLARLGDYLSRPADPFNDHEPVDSSAAAIAAQGLLRLGGWVASHGDRPKGDHYYKAGLTVARSLLAEPYLSTDPAHEGILLHSVYHRPNGWDHIPPGRKIPCGESSMWGDYHLRELAILIQARATGAGHPCFFHI